MPTRAKQRPTRWPRLRPWFRVLFSPFVAQELPTSGGHAVTVFRRYMVTRDPLFRGVRSEPAPWSERQTRTMHLNQPIRGQRRTRSEFGHANIGSVQDPRVMCTSTSTWREADDRCPAVVIDSDKPTFDR